MRPFGGTTEDELMTPTSDGSKHKIFHKKSFSNWKQYAKTSWKHGIQKTSMHAKYERGFMV